MKHKPIGINHDRFETEVDRRFQEIIDNINDSRKSIPHFENTSQANISEGNFCTISNGDEISFYRKINNKLVKVV